MIAAAILALSLQAATPTPPPAQGSDALQAAMPTLFLFYRLRYFRDVAEVRRCLSAQPERTRALNDRYDALHRRLVARLGAAAVDSPRTGRAEPEPDTDCRMGITLFGYENALGELERHLAGSAQ